MPPFRSTPPPRRQQIAMIVVMLAALVAILFFRDRCIGAVTGGFRTLAPMADGGARPTDGGPDARR